MRDGIACAGVILVENIPVVDSSAGPVAALPDKQAATCRRIEERHCRDANADIGGYGIPVRVEMESQDSFITQISNRCGPCVNLKVVAAIRVIDRRPIIPSIRKQLPVRTHRRIADAPADCAQLCFNRTRVSVNREDRACIEIDVCRHEQIHITQMKRSQILPTFIVIQIEQRSSGCSKTAEVLICDTSDSRDRLQANRIAHGKRHHGLFEHLRNLVVRSHDQIVTAFRQFERADVSVQCPGTAAGQVINVSAFQRPGAVIRNTGIPCCQNQTIRFSIEDVRLQIASRHTICIIHVKNYRRISIRIRLSWNLLDIIEIHVKAIEVHIVRCGNPACHRHCGSICIQNIADIFCATGGIIGSRCRLSVFTSQR